jgi:cytochrome c oxidase subunit 2
MILLLGNLRLMPPGASTQATIVDRLMGLQIYVIAFLFALIMVFLLYSVVVFRRRAGDDGDGAYITGNAKLELVWTVIPLLTVIFFATLGSIDLTRMTKPEANELVVDVTGAQFSWTFDYPDYGITSSELVLPVNQAVLFKIRSKDVIHSFWVPEFRSKQDAVPDRLTTLRITTSEMGEFKVRCAEMCGYAHSYMQAPVRVVSQADFQAWLTQQQGGAAPGGGTGSAADRGKQVADQNGCLACHSIDGSVKVAPTWKGLYGHQVTFSDGSTATADDAYIKESIVNPGAKIVKGFSDIMPKTYSTLPEDDVNALVEYIKTLK